MSPIAESTRKKLAVAAIALAALAADVGLLKDAAGSADPSRPEMVAAYEERFAGLRGALRGNDSAGYMTDLPPHDVSAQTELRLLQYAVAPVIVVNSIHQKLVIGNFHTTAGVAEATRGQGLTLVKDLGKGVILFRRFKAF